MSEHKPQKSRSKIPFTRRFAIVACIFFVIAVGLSPGPGSSIGMPWSVFYCTWGVMVVASIFTLIGYIGCKIDEERISLIYAILPALLVAGLEIFIHQHEISSMYLRFIGLED